MRYLLDTNICIYLIKRRPSEVLERFRQHSPQDVAISTITLFELVNTDKLCPPFTDIIFPPEEVM